MSRERHASRFNLFNWNKKIVLVYVLTGREEKIARVSEDLPGMTRVLHLKEALLCIFTSQ